jgi:pyridoxamine 5'-phosphate oxidase family protein
MAQRTFTPEELAYLRTQPLGRLATVDPHGSPQNNPVGFVLTDDGQFLIGGLTMGASRKFRNVRGNPNVAFVVDDLVSTDPWTPRMVEIRGTAEALEDVDPVMPGMSRELIRVTPTWVTSFGVG